MNRRGIIGNSRRGFGMVLIMVGILLLSISFFTGQSKRVIDLLARQKKILLDLRRADIPGRTDSVVAREEGVPVPVSVDLPGEQETDSWGNPFPRSSGR